jgi:formyltetrahydrofolate deformylase
LALHAAEWRWFQRKDGDLTTHILLIDCADQKGLVHHITGVLLRHEANITSNHEFVDHATAHFFMRTEFSGDIDRGQVLAELRARLPAAARARFGPAGKRRIVVLATREHHCLGELLLRHSFGELNATIEAVVSNHAALQGLVERFEVDFHHIGAEDLSRAEHEQALIERIDGYQPEYVVLAKYMRVLTPAFVARYRERIINIHHSFLPAFVGANPYRQAFERGVKIIGATAHYVTDELDEGPIIAQSIIPVDHTQSAAAMMQAGRDVEKTVLARALRLVFEERVFLNGNRTVIFE